MTGVGVTVILGPKTRLGRAAAERLRAAGEQLLLVARDERDVAQLGPKEAVLPGEMVSRLASLAPQPPGGRSLAPRPPSVRLLVAALGPVQAPGLVPDVGGEAPRVLRDLAVVEQVLGTGLPVHVVLISSVIALAPGDDRRYYGGWKNLIEEQVAHLVSRHPGCGLSVLYPGRLVESPGKPAERLHTTYARLAGEVLSIDASRPRCRLVGIDARIWLMVRSISLATRSLAGSWDRSRPRSGGPVGTRSTAGDPGGVG